MVVFYGEIVWWSPLHFLTELHDGHPGMAKMKGLARMYVWWPGISAEIEAIVRQCHACQLQQSDPALASTPGRIFAFTSDLAKIRPGIDCMLENMPPSLINRAPEVSLAFQLIKLFQTCLNFQRQWSPLATRV